MNTFVQYLDQFNVLSPNHAKIYDEYTSTADVNQYAVETRIEQYLLSMFAESPRSVIMTGNAGDGKTRLCRTIYEQLTGESLQQWPTEGIVEAEFSHGTLRIVKDLSELTESVIGAELARLQAFIDNRHQERVYYLIAANEGKLTKYLAQNQTLKALSDDVKERFLNQSNNDDRLYLVNLQDVTSSIYADRIMEAWNREDNWEACNSCSKKANCIVQLNHRRMSQPVIRSRLVEQYRLLDCLGIHVTMREMLIHISYALTGGLTCEQVLHANYKDAEAHASLAYYDNFYGVQMPDVGSGELGAIRHFRKLDPGQLSISSIDDFLLNGDISGEPDIATKHAAIFDEEVDLLFGYYRKQIEVYRTHDQDKDAEIKITRLMPKFRRKYFFECEDGGQGLRQRLVPYLHYYRFRDCLTDKQTQASIRRELIQGLNHAFSKKLLDRSESQLFAVNENLLIHYAYSTGQVKLTVDESREDIDYLPSKLYLTVDHETTLEVRLPVFEYLFRLAGGGLFLSLKQEVDILLSTFRNDLLRQNDPDEYSLQVLALTPEKGVFARRDIDI